MKKSASKPCEKKKIQKAKDLNIIAKLIQIGEESLDFLCDIDQELSCVTSLPDGLRYDIQDLCFESRKANVGCRMPRISTDFFIFSKAVHLATELDTCVKGLPDKEKGNTILGNYIPRLQALMEKINAA